MIEAAQKGRSGLIAAGCLIGIALAALIGLPSVFRLLHETWTQLYAAFAHGYLVLGLAIWLGIRNWRRSPPAAVGPYWPAALPTIAIGSLIALLDNLGLGATRLVFLPALLLSAAWWVLGRDVAKTLLIPAVLLHFALPPWALLDRPLQWLTTTVVNFAVNLTSIPAYVEGNHFHLPAGTFEIALGCSGLNYLITALALFAFQGAAYTDSRRDRTLMLLVASAVALVANWVRVYLLIAIGYWTEMQHYLIRVEHHYFGWVLFAVLMWPVLNWAVSLEQRRAPMPVPHRGFALRKRGTFVAAGVAMICVAGLRALTPPTPVTPTELAALPDSIGEWTATGATAHGWQPRFEGASISIREYATAKSPPVLVLRVAYSRQSAESRLDSPKNDVAGSNALLQAEWSETLETADGEFDAVVRQLRIDGRTIMLWTIKAVGGIPYRTRLDGLLAELSPEKAGNTAVLAGVGAECPVECSEVQQTLRNTAARLLPTLLIVDETS
jgi:exosortase